MAQTVVMPQLGNTVESCLITAWLVKVGDTVTPDTTICDIETDKSAMDVPAGVSGVVLKLLVEEGDDVPVKSPICVVGEAGESVDDAPDAAGAAEDADDESAEGGKPSSDTGELDGSEPPEVTGEAGEVDEGADDGQTPDVDRDLVEAGDTSSDGGAARSGAASPRARRLADAEGLSLDAVAEGTGPHGRVIERDVQGALASGTRPTPGARRDADADRLAGVAQGTGIGGRATREDLEKAQPVRPAGLGAPAAEFPGEYTDTPLKGVRKIIAERMMHAWATVAPVTYNASAPASGVQTLRKRFKGSDPELGYSGITIGDLVCYAAVKVLAHHENLNANLVDGTLRTFRSVHLGLAVDTPRGLLVPTIRNADALTLRQFSAASKELAEQAIGGKIDPELLSGATFTVSNLGAFGIESFSPVINVPQTGILGVDTIMPRPVLNDDGAPGVELRIGFSLTADHQAVDGADAARFLKDLSAAVSDIDLTILG